MLPTSALYLVLSFFCLIADQGEQKHLNPISHSSKASSSPSSDTIYYAAKPSQIRMYWRLSRGEPIASFTHLFYLHKNLIFATNGGMFTTDLDNKPAGLYIEEGKKIIPLQTIKHWNTKRSIPSQGVFLITTDTLAMVMTASEYLNKPPKALYATQSGPMLVMNGKVNPVINGYKSRTIRNGVGILPSGDILLLASMGLLTYAEFAQIFIEKGCTTAMQLDAFITYALPPSNVMFSGFHHYGPFIGVTN